MGGKNAPICYIPEQDPVQDALERAKMTTYFKLTLPNIGNEIKLVICASGTPEQFLLHVHMAMHVSKQISLGIKEAEDMIALEAAYCKLDAAKAEYAKLAGNSKHKAKESKEKEETAAPVSRKKTKELKEQADILAPDIIADTSTLAAACKEAIKKVEEAKLVVTMAGAKPFKLYGSLLSDEVQQPWGRKSLRPK